jgi:S1-C subfamily serine protease
MDIFTQLVYVVGRVQTDGVNMLGTGFLVTPDGKIATSKHVIGNDDKNLVILAPHITSFNQYQDTSDTKCNPISIKLIDADPFRDIAILKADITFNTKLPGISSFDTLTIGENVGIFGYPHCVEGRRVLTFQRAEIGSKILIDTSGITSKYAVINTQTRPGQSGSLIYNLKNNEIVGLLIGAYSPAGAGISLGGINPRELHQTTQCVSAEYIQNIIKGV